MSILIFLADEGPVDSCDPSNDHIAKFGSECLQFKHQIGLADRDDVDSIRSDNFRFFYFAFEGTIDGVLYFFYSELDLQVLHDLAVEVDVEGAFCHSVDLFDRI